MQQFPPLSKLGENFYSAFENIGFIRPQGGNTIVIVASFQGCM